MEEEPPPPAWLTTLAQLILADPHRPQDRPQRMIEALIAEIDATLSAQINTILHAPEFQALEASWRGLWMLVRAADPDAGVKVKILNIGKRELVPDLTQVPRQCLGSKPDFQTDL